MAEKLEEKTPEYSESFPIRPVVALRNLCPIPDNKIRFEAGREKSIEALLVAEKNFHKEVILLLQKNEADENPNPEDLYEYGVLGVIDFKIKQPSDNYKIRITALKRIKIHRVLSDAKYLAAQYEIASDYQSDPSGVKVLISMINKELEQNAKNYIDGVSVLTNIKSETDPDIMANMIMFNLKTVSEKDKYHFLSIDDLNKRLDFLLKTLRQLMLYRELEQKINQSVDESLAKNQKEYYLREKIRAIQDELGDRTSREEDIDKFKKKMEESKMPESIKAKMNDEINRYLATPSMSSEAGVIRSYLEFATNLPWSYETEDSKDIKLASKILDESHYGLKKPKERILEYLAVKIKTMKNPQSIICFVGPPGVGKTSLAFSIAKALNKKMVKMSLGGTRDEAEIRGHRRTYVGAMPGRILKNMEKAGCINPLFLLDEVDKMAQSNQGDPISALLEVLDPEQNFRFSDNYLEEPYDLSKVLFITTANYIENIPEPLKDRMEIIELSSYTEIEKFHIAKKYLIKKSLEEHGLSADEFELSDDLIYVLIRHYTREAGVRQLSRLIDSLVRKTIKAQLEKRIEKTIVDEKLVEKYLGPKIFNYNLAKQSDRVGVVTGLAYTQYGGDTLDVEIAKFPGKGNILITGKLGEVMKESALTAFSYVKSICQSKKIDPEIFSKNDFHIHVPEGAVPKDGPSAGITLATAIYSLVKGEKVSKEVGMTGEITLTGNILPIGGLREKSIAAHRSGLKKILIPYDNKKDLFEVPDEVKKDLKIIPVKSLDEVFKNAIVKDDKLS